MTDAKDRRGAIKAVAAYSRHNAEFFVIDARRASDPEVRSRHIERITELADELDGLAMAGSATYRQFEAILANLHGAGFWPEKSLVAEVTQAFRPEPLSRKDYGAPALGADGSSDTSKLANEGAEVGISPNRPGS